MSWVTVLGYFTGLAWLADMDAQTLVRTTLVVHTCDAIMCRVFAKNNGYPQNLWTLLGFVFGIWAVVVTILLPNQRGVSRRQPEASPGAP